VNCGKHVINNIWTDSLINVTCPSPNVSSNCLFHDRRYPSLSVTHCISHTLSLCLSAVLLSSPILIIWYKNPGIHFQIIIDRNKLFEHTSFLRLLTIMCSLICVFIAERVGRFFLLIKIRILLCGETAQLQAVNLIKGIIISLQI
jgi:hypothetical protein